MCLWIDFESTTLPTTSKNYLFITRQCILNLQYCHMILKQTNIYSNSIQTHCHPISCSFRCSGKALFVSTRVESIDCILSIFYCHIAIYCNQLKTHSTIYWICMVNVNNLKGTFLFGLDEPIHRPSMCIKYMEGHSIQVQNIDRIF